MKMIIRVSGLLALAAGVAAAQNPPVAQPQPQPQRQQQQQRQRMQRPAQGGQQARQANRAELEQQIKDRIGGALKTNLGLSDDQFTKLQATNKRFETQRRLLVEQERDVRMGMRDLMISGDTTNQAKVSAGLDRMLQVQRQRFELVEQEQKELAGYLTPMQRMKFLGMQEQIFRRMEAMRRGPGAGMGPEGPPMDGGQGRAPGMRNPQGRPGMGGRRPPPGPDGPPPVDQIPPV